MVNGGVTRASDPPVSVGSSAFLPFMYLIRKPPQAMISYAAQNNPPEDFSAPVRYRDIWSSATKAAVNTMIPPSCSTALILCFRRLSPFSSQEGRISLSHCADRARKKRRIHATVREGTLFSSSPGVCHSRERLRTLCMANNDFRGLYWHSVACSSVADL